MDPKSVLCAFFKQGQCYKGDKCKFSHDLTIERKSEKRSVYGAGEQGNYQSILEYEGFCAQPAFCSANCSTFFCFDCYTF